MDKETLSNYGWIVICVLVLVVMIALATPFGSFVSGAVQSTTKGLFDVNHTALESTGLIEIDDQEFDEKVNSGDVSAKPDTRADITFSFSGVTYQAKEGMTWSEWCASEYGADFFINEEGKVVSKVDTEEGTVIIGYSYMDGMTIVMGSVKSNEAIVAGKTYSRRVILK